MTLAWLVQILNFRTMEITLILIIDSTVDHSLWFIIHIELKFTAVTYDFMCLFITLSRK